jgi:hypothetical protein
MSQAKHNQARRHFLKWAAGTAVVVAAGSSIPSWVYAADMPHVSPDDPTAKALGYVEDANQSSNPQRKAGDTCANCQFFSAGTGGYGPCQLFPGKQVNAKGWCISHTPK